MNQNGMCNKATFVSCSSDWVRDFVTKRNFVSFLVEAGHICVVGQTVSSRLIAARAQIVIPTNCEYMGAYWYSPTDLYGAYYNRPMYATLQWLIGKSTSPWSCGIWLGTESPEHEFRGKMQKHDGYNTPHLPMPPAFWLDLADTDPSLILPLSLLRPTNSTGEKS